MIKLLLIGLLLLLPTQSWATAFTSKATGNWSASGQTTWNQTGVPGAGDTVSTSASHTITVDTNTTIGTSGAAGTSAILAAGPLIVPDGVELIARGDVTISNAQFTLDGGSIYTFDDNSSGAVYQLNIGAQNSTTSKLFCNGTPSKRVTIRSKSGGVNGRISNNGFTGGGQMDCTYTDLLRLGSATLHAIDFYPIANSIFRLQTSVILTSSGKIGQVVNPNGSSTIILDGVTTVSSLDSRAATLTFNATISTGTWSITNCVFDKAIDMTSPKSVTMTGNYLTPAVVFSDAAMTALSGNLFVRDNTAFSDMNVFADVTDNYWLHVGPVTNPHMFSMVGLRSQVASGNILEYTGSAANGDMVLLSSGAPATPQTYTIKHNILLPAAGSPSTVSSGKIISQGGSVNNTLIIAHNTINVGAQVESGVGVGETYLGKADMFTSIQDNLAWSNSGDGYIVQQQGATPTANTITTADYNGRTTMTGSYNVAAGTIRNAAGLHDVIGDPQFVDKTRNIAAWDLSLGGPGTAANALAELAKRNNASGYNTAYTIAALITYVKAGFVPANTAFNAASDNVAPSNGWMGALQGIPPVIAPPVSTIPELATWESNMTSAGATTCSALITALGTGDINTYLPHTYYDSLAVYLQIKQYTGDAATWDPCIVASRTAFRDNYVIANSGGVTGIENFTRGVRLDWQLNAEATSKSAEISMSHNAAFATDGTNLANIQTPARSREVAYAIRSYVNSEILGDGRRARLLQYVDTALSHIDQWFISKSYQCEVTECTQALLGTTDAIGKRFVQPFMVGLTMEALIAYYGIETDATKKANVLAKVRIAADALWDHLWYAPDQAFPLNNWAPTGEEFPSPSVSLSGPSTPDLNLLIAPAYAWLYHVLGSTTYRDRGDAIFAKGVTDAFLGNKQFDQNYQTSFDYVAWRLATPLGRQAISRTQITQPRARRQ